MGGTGVGVRFAGSLRRCAVLAVVVISAVIALVVVALPAAAAMTWSPDGLVEGGEAGEVLLAQEDEAAEEEDAPAAADEEADEGEEDEGGDAGALSLLPPLLAIGLALVTRQIIPSLVAGVWVGAWLVAGPGLAAVMTSLLDVIGVYVVDALSDPDHVAILVFTMMIGGMVGIIRRNGGTDGIVDAVVGWASTRRRGQLGTAGLGVAIFFDDYANTLVVGNTMRPITDRLRISREKLAYIVDSTAAPIATLGLVTTWIGFQIGLIGDALGDTGMEMSPYGIFIRALPYSFYPILAIVFVFLVAATQRDAGPMLAAERRAATGEVLRQGSDLGGSDHTEEALAPPERAPKRVFNAVLPIITLVGVTIVGLLATGEGDGLIEIVGDGDAFAALLWGSLLSVLVAAGLSIGQRILGLSATVDAWFDGLKAVLYVLIILTLAWALSAVTEDLGTGDYLAGTLGEALPPELLPALLFVIAGAVAFATGTSWGTMGILTPLALPLAWAVLDAQGLADPGGHPLLFAAVSTVLAGAVWGDHCSPISDTTVISSLASQCDVVDHVRTQLPYALGVGAVAVLIGLLPVGLGVPWWLLYPIAIAALVLGLRLFGEPVGDDAETTADRPGRAGSEDVEGSARRG